MSGFSPFILIIIIVVTLAQLVGGSKRKDDKGKTSKEKPNPKSKTDVSFDTKLNSSEDNPFEVK